MSAMSAAQNVTAGCRWVIIETLVRQSIACESEMGIVYLPSPACLDVTHVLGFRHGQRTLK